MNKISNYNVAMWSLSRKGRSPANKKGARRLRQRAMALLVPSLLATVAGAEERKVTASIAVKQEYTDNLTYSSVDPQSDWITTVSPKVEVVNNSDRLQTSLKAVLDGASYWEHNELNDVDQDFSGSLRYGFTPRTNLFTSAGYRRDSRSDREFSDTGLVFDAVERERYNFALGGNYSLSELTALQVQYNHGKDDYHGDRYSDNQTHGVSGTLSRNLSEYWENTTGRFSLGATRYDSDTSQTDYFTGTVGVEKSLTETIGLYVDGGMRYTESSYDTYEPVYYNFLGHNIFVGYRPITAQETGIGFTGRTGLTYRDELNEAVLSASHDVQPANGESGTLERSSLQARLEHRLTEQSRISLSGGYALNKTADEVAYIDTTDETSWWVQPRISYNFDREWLVEGSYNYGQIHDNEDDDDRSRNLVMLRLEYRYPIWE